MMVCTKVAKNGAPWHLCKKDNCRFINAENFLATVFLLINENIRISALFLASRGLFKMFSVYLFVTPMWHTFVVNGYLLIFKKW
jgi:hypothetical protein